MVIKSAERSRYVCTLFSFDFKHKFSNVIWNRIHPQCVKTSFQHVSLDSNFIEWSCPLSYCLVWVLSKKKIYLFKCSSIGFNTVEASHINNNRGNLFKLVYARDIFAGRLPHIPIQ